MTTAEILLKAADLIEPEGRWIQRKLATRSLRATKSLQAQDPMASCFCMVGALCKVSGADNWASLPHADLLEQVILDVVGPEAAGNALGLPSIAGYNDAPGRAQAEVVQALRDAAKAAS